MDWDSYANNRNAHCREQSKGSIVFLPKPQILEEGIVILALRTITLFLGGDITCSRSLLTRQLKRDWSLAGKGCHA